MKKLIRIITILMAIAFFGCEKDSEFSNNPPRIDLLTPSLKGAIGKAVTIQANLEDDYVLKYAKLICPSLALDKTVMITIKNRPTNASNDVIKSIDSFSYVFNIPDFAVSGESYEIELWVKNCTGQITTAKIILTVI